MKMKIEKLSTPLAPKIYGKALCPFLFNMFFLFPSLFAHDFHVFGLCVWPWGLSYLKTFFVTF